MRRLVLVIPLCLLFIAVALSVDGSFYVSLLERGKAHFAEGKYDLAAKELRIAAFGLLDDIPKYETAHLLLALTQQRLGNTDLAATSVRKLYDAERVTRAYSTLPIDISVRRSFEQLAASVLTREEFASLTRATPPATQEATTPSTTTSRVEPPPQPSVDAERIAAQRREQERIAAETREQERIAAQRREQERIAAERREQERIAAERREQERIAAQRSEEQRTAAQHSEEERAAIRRRDEERAAALRREGERLAAERQAAERREKERLSSRRREEQQASAQRRDEDVAAAQRRENERLAAQRREEERIAAERREEETAAAQRRQEEQRIVAERREQEQAAQRRESERLQAQRSEQERLEAQRQEAARLETQRRDEAARAAAPATEQPVRVQVRPTAQRASLPADVRRLLDTADRALEQGNIEQAHNIYIRLLRSGTTSRDAMLEVARGLYQTADFPGAVEAFSRIGALRAGEEDFHYYAAVALFEIGEFAAARKQLLCALPFIRVTDDVARYRAKIEGMIN